MLSEQNSCLLPQADNQTLMVTLDTYADLAVALLTHYSFDLGGYEAQEIVEQWQFDYPQNWLHLAVIEALYQGRYKAFSVQQILSMWHRREQATYHFNMEFERLICSKFPVNLRSTQTRSHSSSEFFQSPEPAANTTRKKSSAATSLHLMENGRSYLQEQTFHLLPPKSEPPEENRRQEYGKLNDANVTKLQPDVTQYSVTDWEEMESPVKVSHQPPYQTVNPPISHFSTQKDNRSLNKDLTNTLCEKLTDRMERLLPASTNHPPIDQFTPTADEHSATFTSKLYAMIEQE